MVVAKHARPADRKLARERAREWKRFRQDYLYSQRHLAAALGCSKRTISAVETAETTYPLRRTLQRFAALKRKHEREEYEAAERRGQLEALRAARYAPIYSGQGA